LTIYSKEFDSEQNRQLFMNLDTHLDLDAHLLKRSKGRTVGVLKINGKKVGVKRYNIRGFWHSIKIALRPSRASKSWMNAFHLNSLNIKTITPIALIEKRKGPFRNVSYFLWEFADGKAGCEYFLDDSPDKANWPIAIVSVEKLIQKMRSHRLYHSDLHLGNFLMAESQAVLLDLDNLKHYFFDFSFRYAQQKDRNMFLKSLDAYPQAKISFNIHAPQI
jgi:hypothetical protein